MKQIYLKVWFSIESKIIMKHSIKIIEEKKMLHKLYMMNQVSSVLNNKHQQLILNYLKIHNNGLCKNL